MLAQLCIGPFHCLILSLPTQTIYLPYPASVHSDHHFSRIVPPATSERCRVFTLGTIHFFSCNSLKGTCLYPRSAPARMSPFSTSFNRGVGKTSILNDSSSHALVESVEGGMDCQSFQIRRHAPSGRNRVQPATCHFVNTRWLASGRTSGYALLQLLLLQGDCLHFLALGASGSSGTRLYLYRTTLFVSCQA